MLACAAPPLCFDSDLLHSALFETIVEIARPTPLIVNASKGLDHKNLQTLSMFVKKRLGKMVYDRYAVLSGPSFAKEVAEGKPTALSLACVNEDHLIRLGQSISLQQFSNFPNQRRPRC
jgi:glycerol-3-phosphate dehydrogenase (NAD(P)+)